MPNHLDGLSQEQLEVAKTTTGIRFVLACPGGGKTKTLVSSIAELIEQGVEPATILAFTFTKAAAQEMSSRLKKVVSPSKASLVDVGTMHSIFFRILRENASKLGRQEIRVLDERKADHKKMLRRLLKKRNLREDDYPVADLVKRIGRLKNEGLKPGDAEALDFLLEGGLPEAIAQASTDLWGDYEEEKWKEGVIDFDDMLTLTLDLFRVAPTVANKYAEKWQYIFVDETHDINPVQNELIKLLNSKHGNLFCVCDPHQSIYGFRGAHPEIVLSYDRHYPGAILQRLSKNFRSKSQIVEASYKLIGNNPDPLKMGATSDKPGGIVQWDGPAKDVNEEAARVAEFITSRVKAGENKYEDFFILFRTNAQSRAPEEAMVRNALPYRLLGLSSFYSRKEVQDLLAYLSFAADPDPFSEAFERIYNKPNRFLGKAWYREFSDQLTDVDSWKQVLKNGHWSKTYMRRGAMTLLGQLTRIVEFYEEMKRSDKLNLGDVARMIVNQVGYDEWCLRDDEDGQERVDNVYEFISTVERFESTEKLLSYISAVTESLKKSTLGEDKVTLATIHKSKGLEAKVVFVLGFADGLLPHAKATSMEEERRLAFVAISRGEEEVYLSMPEQYRNNPMEPSRFAVELGLVAPPLMSPEMAMMSGPDSMAAEVIRRGPEEDQPLF